MKVMQHQTGGVDVLFMPGDFVAHGIAMDPEKPSKGSYELLKKTLESTADLVHSNYPNAFFAPSWGNNDFKYHYQAPYEG